MAGRPRSSSFAIPSSYLIAGLSLLALASIFFFLLSPSRFDPDRNPTTLPFPRNPNTATPEHSFVASLKKFLTSRPRPPVISDTAAVDDGGATVTTLDDAIWRSAAEGLLRDPSDPWSRLSVVRVYVYEMPSKFTYDLLWLFMNTYKETTNLTSNGSPVHRLIEQHSIDYWLWLDLIAPKSERLLRNVVRVYRQEEADLFYIPFFTTISYFLLEKQQCKVLYRVWGACPRRH